MMETPPQLEQEIANIERDLAQKREQLKSRQSGAGDLEQAHDKELLREVYHEQFKSPAEEMQGGGLANQPSAAPPHGAHGPASLPPQFHSQLQDLVNVAFQKSIGDAVAQARATHNAALVDALHDVLVDQLYDELVERGILKRF